MEEGRIAIVTTRAGRRWARSHRREGLCRAGNREQSHRANDRCDARTAKSCGPGARSLCAKSRGDVRCPTGRTHQPSAGRRGQ